MLFFDRFKNRASSYRDISEQQANPSNETKASVCNSPEKDWKWSCSKVDSRLDKIQKRQALIEEQCNCINAVDVFSQESIASIPQRHFIKTDDGYGHDMRHLARYMHISIANPATRKPLSAADIERLMCSSVKHQMLEAAISHRRQATEAFGEGYYSVALRHCNDAISLNSGCWALWFVRIDSLAALGRFEEARIQTSELVQQVKVPWALQVRQHGLSVRLNGVATPVEDLPVNASLDALKCAIVFCLHCRCSSLAKRLSHQARIRAPYDLTIQALCDLSGAL